MASVLKEYFDTQHVEPIPESELTKLYDEVYYLSMHSVEKELSMTSKICVMFDASVKTRIQHIIE